MAGTEPGASGRAIHDFWSWWSREGADTALAALETGDYTRIATRLDEHVRAVDSALEWSLAADENAGHALCVTGAGDPGLRCIAQRWLDAAPTADVDWAFHAARQREPNPGSVVLEIDGVRAAVADARVSVTFDDQRHTVDVALERWVGVVDSVPAEHASHRVSDLAGIVDALAVAPIEDAWTQLRGETRRVFSARLRRSGIAASLRAGDRRRDRRPGPAAGPRDRSWSAHTASVQRPSRHRHQ